MAEDANDPEDADDILAFEMVLGLLTTEERLAAEERVLRDPRFARLVADVRRVFGPLDAEYEPQPPPAYSKRAIDKRIGARRAQTGRTNRRSALSAIGRFAADRWADLRIWRAATVAAMAALMLNFATPREPTPMDYDGLMVFAGVPVEAGDPHFIVTIDEVRGEITFHVQNGGEDERFRFWIVDGDTNPRASLGYSGPIDAPLIVARDEFHEFFTPDFDLGVSREPLDAPMSETPAGPLVMVKWHRLR